MKNWRLSLVLLAVSSLAAACTSAATDDLTPVTFSCTQSSANLCTQIVVPQAEVDSEQTVCTGMESGTPGTGCSTSGLIGCCVAGGTGEAAETQCYYSKDTAMSGQSVCTEEGGTWSKTP
jgi:hypothetical protein